MSLIFLFVTLFLTTGLQSVVHPAYSARQRKDYADLENTEESIAQ